MSRLLSDGYAPDAISNSDLSKGGFLLYCVGIFFIFGAIREVCNGYLGPTIDYVVSKFQIQQDIAGATFMAIGNSAPELFICLFSFLLSHSDLGLGTIVGSAAFNSMFIGGFCSLIAKKPLNLHWWPLARDFAFNCALMALLIGFLSDMKIEGYEAVFLLMAYCFYIYFMKNNTQIERFCKKFLNIPYDGDPREYEPLPTHPFKIRRRSISDLESFIPDNLDLSRGVLAKVVRNSQYVATQRSEQAQQISVRFKRVVYIILRALEEEKRCSRRLLLSRGLTYPYREDEYQSAPARQKLFRAQHVEGSSSNLISFTASRSVLSRIKDCIMLPFVALLKLSLPKRPEFWRWRLIGSTAWICFLCYLLAWWSHSLSKALGVVESVIGVLVVSLGVSIPDFLSTVRATKEGRGDMIISGSYGGNNMNIGVSLGLPTLIFAIIWGSFGKITFSIYISTFILLGLQILSFAFLGGFKWRMMPDLGVVLIVFYGLFMLLFLLLQFWIY